MRLCVRARVCVRVYVYVCVCAMAKCAADRISVRCDLSCSRIRMEETALLGDLLAVLEGPFYLSRPCHHHHLLELAQNITEWKTLAPWLGFEATAVEDLDRNRFDEEGKRQAMLRLWKEANGCLATYGHLATLLVNSGRRNLAEFVLNLSKNGNKSSCIYLHCL